MEFDRTRTKAPPRHIELAQKLGTQRGQPVHPDVLVEPLCPVSQELRVAQEERMKKPL